MANFYYDGTAGDDAAGDGSEARPFRSIKMATVGGAQNPRDARFFVKRGTAVQQTVYLTPEGSFGMLPYGPGTEWPVVERNGKYAIVVGSKSVATDKISLSGIRMVNREAVPSISGVSNATGSAAPMLIDSCVFDGFFNGVSLNGGDRHEITNNRIVNSYNNGINADTAGAASNNCLIAKNYIDGRRGDSVMLNDCITLHGGTGVGRGNVIRDNTIIAGTEQCIDVQAMYEGTLVRGNTCYARQDGTSISWSEIVADSKTVIDGNTIFCRYRPAISGFGSGLTISNNILIQTVDGAAIPLIALTATASAAQIVGNVMLARAGMSRPMIEGSPGSVGVVVRHNLMVNYSAHPNLRFVGQPVSSELDTWSVDENQYAQKPGSLVNAWAFGASWSAWRARPGAPDAHSPAPLAW